MFTAVYNKFLPSEKPNRQQQTPGMHVYDNARTLDSNSLTQPIGSDASEQPSLGVQPLAGTKKCCPISV